MGAREGGVEGSVLNLSHKGGMQRDSSSRRGEGSLPPPRGGKGAEGFRRKDDTIVG